jgi:hypothetical protein
VGVAKLYDPKTSLTAADWLNDQGGPFFAAHDVPLSRILTERGTEDCGSPDSQEYERYFASENIDPTRTTGKSPQTKGSGERCPKTRLPEVYRLTFGKNIDCPLAELQADRDRGLKKSNEERVHPGRWCDGRTPRPTYWDTMPLAKEQLGAA